MNNLEFESRRRAAAAALQPFRAGALLVTSLANVRYLTGFTGSNAMALLDAEGEATLFTDPRYTIQASQEVACRVVVARGSLLEAVVGKVRVRRLAFEAAHIGYDAHAHLAARAGKRTELAPVRALVETLRMVKSAAEIDLIRRSVCLNSTAFDGALRTLRPGKTTEAGLAAEIDHRMRRLGADRPAFETIVASGRRSALPHACPTSAVVCENETLLIDMGASREGYASDMTRVVFPGRASARHRKLYRAVAEAQQAAIDAVRPGVSAAHVDRAARRVLRRLGMDRWFVHSTGHGLGLEIHEPPRIGRKDSTRLEPGMAITIEPGAYVEGFGGVRIEDTVVVTRTGCDVLTPTPKELIEL